MQIKIEENENSGEKWNMVLSKWTFKQMGEDNDKNSSRLQEP